VYCVRAKAEASKEMLRILSDMILLQSQDKQFLLKSFGKCSKRESCLLLLIYYYAITINNISFFYCFFTGTLITPNEINLSQNVELAEQNRGNKEVLLFRRRNLPSTSYEKNDCS